MKKSLLLFSLIIAISGLAHAVTPDSLIHTILRGDEALAIRLIKGTDINTQDADGNTALSAAACYYPALVKALLAAKADANLAGRSTITPLFNACRWGDAEAVKMLLEAGADVNKNTTMGSPLLGSFFYPSAAIVKMLLEAGANFQGPEKFLNSITVYPVIEYLKTAKTPSEVVEYYGRLKTGWIRKGTKMPERFLNPKESDIAGIGDIMQLFLDKGYEVNHVYDIDNNKVAALDAAIKAGLADAVRLLVEHGATYSVNRDFPLSERSRMAALYQGLTYSNGDILLIAVMSNKADFVKAMVEKYPSLTKKVYEGRGEVYCHNPKNGNILKNYYNLKGISLLMVAAANGNTDIVHYLVDKGIGKDTPAETTWDSDAKDTDVCGIASKRYAIGFAKSSGKQDLADFLQKAGFSSE